MQKTAFCGWSARGGNRYIPKTLLVMKLTILLLTVGFLNVCANGVSQTVSFSGEKVPLKAVLNSVKQQTGFVFLYSGTVLQVAKPVTVSATAVPLETFLNEVFKNQPLKYVVKGRSILVSPKPVSGGAVFSNEPSTVLSDSSMTVRGRVLNEKGEPVQGASVTVKGSAKGTRTDGNGDFALKNVIAGEVILISYVGYETHSFIANRAMGSSRGFTISIKPSVTKLDEIEITVNTGYQTVAKERATGSFTQIDNKLFNRSTSGNVLDRLEGVTNGMAFIRNNMKGENVDGSQKPDIRIRGVSTIQSKTGGPLIVVDNFPYEGDINSINPNDIESVTVLRDAAAASIWGARAGNGVIVINTKAGKYNQVTRISVNSNVVVGDKPNLFYSKNYLPAPTVMDIQKEIADRGGYPLINQIRSPLYVDLLSKLKDKKITQVEFDEQDEWLRNNDLRADFDKYLYQKAVTQQHSLGLRGGGGNYRYAFSAAYDKGDGMFVGNKSNRMNLSLQNSFKIRRNLELTGTIWYTKRKTENNAVPSSVTNSFNGAGLDIYESLVDADGNPNAVNIQNNRFRYQEEAPGANPTLKLQDWLFRPLDEVRLNNNVTDNTDWRMNFGLKYNFIKHFNLELLYQNTLSMGQQTAYHDVNSYFVRDLVNKYTQKNGMRPIPLGNIYEFYPAGKTNTQYARALLSYSQPFGLDHSVSALAGAEIKEQIFKSTPGSTLYGYDTDLLTNNAFMNYDSLFATLPNGSNRIPTKATTLLEKTTNHDLSYYGNASYTYKGKYILSGSARWDGSNLLGVKTNLRGTLLWSTGLSWDIAKESFFHVKQLPYLRLRATYGKAGNMDRGQTTLPTIQYTGLNAISTFTQARLNTAGNPTLRWEQVCTTNFGADFRAFNNRLSGSVEYYRKDASDLLGSNAVDPTTGVPSTYQMNYAKLRTWGWDIQISSTNLQFKKFSWTSTLQVSTSRNKIKRLKENPPLNDGQYFVTNIYEQNMSVDKIYSLPWNGLNPQDGSVLIYDKDGNVRKDYTNYWNGIKKSGFIYAGITVPPVSGSIMNTFEWNGISVSALIVGRFGHVFRRTSMQPGAEYGNQLVNSFNMDYFKRWQQPGDEKFTNVPAKVPIANVTAAQASNAGNLYQYSEVLITKGDVIKLQDVSLGYQIPKAYIKRWPIQGIRLYGYARSLGILWRANKEGLDPDFPNTLYPQPKSYSAGLQIEF
jgi:TonB-linked SusC/RagA family outer membrane protein